MEGCFLAGSSRGGRRRGPWGLSIRALLPSGFLAGSAVKNMPASAGDTGDTGLIHALGGSPREVYGNPLWYSRLENSIDRGG